MRLRLLAGFDVRRESAGNRAAIAAAGGIERVLAAMVAHAADARVQEEGCAALVNLALDAGAYSRGRRVVVV